MQILNPSVQPRSARRSLQARAAATQRIAIDEYELGTRWGLSVKTLRRWRTEQLGPVFCKLGARVTYLIAEVDAFERQHSRYGTGACVSSDNAYAGGAA
jgi:hypothetical protein